MADVTDNTLMREVERTMTICNACRYCEGLCATFQAMTTRRMFAEADLDYLANLCHDCRACYHGCQYVPPHHFDLPRTRGIQRGDPGGTARRGMNRPP